MLVQLAFVIAMVTGIHFVEAYLLNPAIYSAHLKLHPLLVISTLVVAEHSLGVWGLLLAGQALLPCPACLCDCAHATLSVLYMLSQALLANYIHEQLVCCMRLCQLWQVVCLNLVECLP